MAEARLERQGSPKGLKRAFFRAPIWIYKARLGFLMGRRFLMLDHVGRKSGETRHVVLEVVSEEHDAVYVAAAWSEKAQWLLNVRADPNVTVHLGSSVFPSAATEVDQTEALRVLSTYGSKHPKALKNLARYMLDDPSDSVAQLVDDVSASVPLVRLQKGDG